MLDLLSDLLLRLSLKGTLYFRASFNPPFGVTVPPFENVARFHFVHRGTLHVHVDAAQTTVPLTEGDLILIPHGAGHRLLSAGTSPEDATDLDQVLERAGYAGEGVLVYGGEAADEETQLICGHFSLAPGAKHLLFERLPPFIHLRSYCETGGPWLEASLRVIAAEAGRPRLGGDLVALKLSEAIFAQAIRTFLESEEAGRAQLSGFADPHVARALEAIHHAPADRWTVAALAKLAGQSRTAFAALFAAKMGVSPMQYVTAWRIQLACQALRERSTSVAEVADHVGYRSEAAFARVFKREVGLSPAAYRQANGQGAG